MSAFRTKLDRIFGTGGGGDVLRESLGTCTATTSSGEHLDQPLIWLAEQSDGALGSWCGCRFIYDFGPPTASGMAEDHVLLLDLAGDEQYAKEIPIPPEAETDETAFLQFVSSTILESAGISPQQFQFQRKLDSILKSIKPAGRPAE